MDEISVKLQDAVSDAKIHMAKQRDKIDRLRQACEDQTTVINNKNREIRRLESIIETFDLQNSGVADALAQKDAEIDRLSSENSMLKSGGTYLVGEAVCWTFTEACDEAYNKGAPVTIWKLVLQPVCRWVNA